MEEEIKDMPSINEPPGSEVIPPTGPDPKEKAKVHKGKEDAADPDELEDEIAAAEEDDDVETKHGKPKRKR